MRKSRFTEEQIIRTLREVEAGRPVGDFDEAAKSGEAMLFSERGPKLLGEFP